jgi:hypothetical protein
VHGQVVETTLEDVIWNGGLTPDSLQQCQA